jgi:hypothetical protein
MAGQKKGPGNNFLKRRNKEMKKRSYLPTASQLVDRLAIVTLKSVKIPENKKQYEKEAHAIMCDLDLLLGKNQGRFIRAAQVIGIINEIIWANESKARRGEEQDLKLLKLTHSLNRIRNEAMGVISKILGDSQDLKSDYLDSALTKEFGYDFSEVLS